MENESSIKNCQQGGWNNNSCFHSRDASVICSSTYRQISCLLYRTPWHSILMVDFFQTKRKLITGLFYFLKTAINTWAFYLLFTSGRKYSVIVCHIMFSTLFLFLLVLKNILSFLPTPSYSLLSSIIIHHFIFPPTPPVTKPTQL